MSHSSTAPAGDNPVAGHYWGLRILDGQTVGRGESEVATVRFRKDGGIDGTTGCNSISTGMVWSFDKASGVGRIADDRRQPQIQTAVGCWDRRETAIAGIFWQKMETTDRWSLHGKELDVTFAGGGVAKLVRVATPASERRPDCVVSEPDNFDCPAPR